MVLGIFILNIWYHKSWGPLCANDNLNLINTVVHGVGRDMYWPPNVPRGYTIEDVVGKRGELA